MFLHVAKYKLLHKEEPPDSVLGHKTQKKETSISVLVNSRTIIDPVELLTLLVFT